MATGSPLEDHEDMLAWIAFLRPFFDVCGTQLHHIRRQDAILHLTAKPQREQDVLLTEREKTVLGLIASGLTDAAIADQLHVSKSTVVTLKKRIAQKTGRRTKPAMVAYAYLMGLKPPEKQR